MKTPVITAAMLLLAALAAETVSAEEISAQKSTVNKPSPAGHGVLKNETPHLAPLSLTDQWAVAPPIAERAATKSPPAPLAVSAGSSRAEPSVYCRVPIQTLGSVELYGSVAIIKGNSIQIQQSYVSYGAAPPQLQGVVIRLDDPNALGGGRKEVTGLALFTGGNLLSEFGSAGGQDIIFRNEGSVAGDVLFQDRDSLIVRKKDGQEVRIPLDAITYIRSPRAFLFTLTGRSAEAGKSSASASAGSGSGRSQVVAISFQSTYGRSAADSSTPTSVVPEKQDPYGLMDDDNTSPGFTFTSSGSRSPIFDNNMPPNMPRRGVPGLWP